MQIIPNLPILQDDELLISYLLRIVIANDKTNQLNNIEWFFSFKGNDFYKSIKNLADNLNVNPIELFKKTTLFSYRQILMSRAQIKNTVDYIFNYDEKNNRDFYYLTVTTQDNKIYYCPDCTNNDIDNYGFKFIHKEHQFVGYCLKHHRKLETLNPQDFFNLSIPKNERILPCPNEYESTIVRSITSLVAYIDQNDLLVNYDDVLSIIKKEYLPNHFFITRSFIQIENMVEEFTLLNYIKQCDLLTEFYFYYEKSKDKGFSLADYPIILLGILSQSIKYPSDLYVKLKHYKENLWLKLLLCSSASNLKIINSKESTILTVKDLKNNTIKNVSAYSILDGKK